MKPFCSISVFALILIAGWWLLDSRQPSCVKQIYLKAIPSHSLVLPTVGERRRNPHTMT